MGNSFPENAVQALAMLYLQSRDLSKKSPEEICDLYIDTLKRISNHEQGQKE